MRIARDEIEERQRELPGRTGRGEMSGVGMGRWQEQGEVAVGGLEDAGRQGDDAVDQLAQTKVGEAGVWQQDAPLPPIEEVGGEGGVKQERFEAGEGTGPQALELESGGRLGEPALDGLAGLVERLEVAGRQFG